jgi:hypothetical protein
MGKVWSVRAETVFLRFTALSVVSTIANFWAVVNT